MRYFTFFSYNSVFEICYVLYDWSTSQSRQATFQVLGRHMWLVLMTTVLDSTVPESSPDRENAPPLLPHLRGIVESGSKW